MRTQATIGVLIAVIVAIFLWWAFFRAVRIVFPLGFENTESNAGQIENWLFNELDSSLIARDHDGRYWVVAIGELEARAWRRKAANAFGLRKSTIELRGRW